jgi:hypothetical protein
LIHPHQILLIKMSKPSLKKHKPPPPRQSKSQAIDDLIMGVSELINASIRVDSHFLITHLLNTYLHRQTVAALFPNGVLRGFTTPMKPISSVISSPNFRDGHHSSTVDIG